MDLAQFGAQPKQKKKSNVDYTAIEALVNKVDDAKLRLSYQSFQYLATQVGVMKAGLPVLATFHHLDRISRPWVVCTNKGTYSDTALVKFARFKDVPTDLLTRAIVQIDQVEGLFEELTASSD